MTKPRFFRQINTSKYKLKRIFFSLIFFSYFFRYGFFMMVSFTLTFFMGISLKKHEWYVNLNHIASFVRPGNKFFSKTDQAMVDKKYWIFLSPFRFHFGFFLSSNCENIFVIFVGNVDKKEQNFYQIKCFTTSGPSLFFPRDAHIVLVRNNEETNTQWKNFT